MSEYCSARQHPPSRFVLDVNCRQSPRLDRSRVRGWKVPCWTTRGARSMLHSWLAVFVFLSAERRADGR